MPELHPYYQNRERKNEALIDCWSKAIWFSVWIILGFGMGYLIYKGFICVFFGH